jgi:hypothetical protein
VSGEWAGVSGGERGSCHTGLSIPYLRKPSGTPRPNLSASEPSFTRGSGFHHPAIKGGCLQDCLRAELLRRTESCAGHGSPVRQSCAGSSRSLAPAVPHAHSFLRNRTAVPRGVRGSPLSCTLGNCRRTPSGIPGP